MLQLEEEQIYRQRPRLQNRDSTNNILNTLLLQLLPDTERETEQVNENKIERVALGQTYSQQECCLAADSQSAGREERTNTSVSLSLSRTHQRQWSECALSGVSELRSNGLVSSVEQRVAAMGNQETRVEEPDTGLTNISRLYYHSFWMALCVC